MKVGSENRALQFREVPHTDLVSHPYCHWGLQNPGFLVEILPRVLWKGVSGRDRMPLYAFPPHICKMTVKQP